MAFVPWKDRVTATPHRYKLTEVSPDTYDLTAVPGAVSEAGTPVNAENLDKLIQRDGDDIKDTVVAFTEAGARANISTGESTATLFGKIKKYFTDLKAHSFVAPSTTQGTGTTTVPCDKLLKESSFARVYREATEITGITYPVAIGVVLKAMKDQNLLNTMLTVGCSNANENKITGLPVIGSAIQPYGMLVVQVPGLDALRMRVEYSREIGTGNVVKWIGGINRTDPNNWTVDWRMIIDDSLAQTISGIKTFSVSPLVPVTPSGPAAAVSKSYVDSVASNPNLLVNADFFWNDLGSATYTSAGAAVNHWNFALTGGTTGSYTVATKTLKSDTYNTPGKFVSLQQYIDNPTRLNGKTVTLSINAVSSTGNFLIQLWKTASGETTSLGQAAYDATLYKSLTVSLASDAFAIGDTLRVVVQSYSETVLDYMKLEIGSVATQYTPTTTFLTREKAEKITSIKTFATNATPIITDAPTTSLQAVNKAYADSLIVYDKIIRTQAEFEALIVSPTWLGATSVALVGQFTLSTANNSGIEIPATVKQIHGFNSAKITITNFAYNSSTAIGGLWYATRPSTSGYEIRGVDLDISGDAAVGFCNCIGLRCSDIIANSSSFNAVGVYDCWDIDSIKSKATAPAGKTGYGFVNINGATKCTDGGSSTKMWEGTNTNIDLDTCRKNPVGANNTTLNT